MLQLIMSGIFLRHFISENAVFCRVLVVRRLLLISEK